ncbi:ATP-binding cassette domain-containing protein [bacterium]|nr:ATP-binding cassette domain-containing protein [bacterium]MBU1880495.1 ATP-binding cassette domain-containing protein [bacterium]
MQETEKFCIYAKNLSFVFHAENTQPLKDLSLEVQSGETIALLGANGSGKSTLAKLLTGLLEPTSGELNVLGCDLCTPEGRHEVRGEVGIVFQYPDEQMVATTVEREIAFGPENLRIESSEIRRRVDHYLAHFHLDRYKNQSPVNLSGGEKQRLALASVLAMEPKILIMDEVTALLDPRGRELVMASIKELKGKTTMLLITQKPEEAMIADRLTVLREGALHDLGNPADAFQNQALMQKYNIQPPLVFNLLHAASRAANLPENN